MSKNVRAAVVLSGSGVYDGSEIHEAVITLLALDRAGAEAVCVAPNVDQLHVVNHLTGDVVGGERRNALVEAARIARGKVRDVATLAASEVDALLLPGGFGAAKNLCDFAVRGAGCSVHPEVARAVREVHAARKPIGAMCIAPALVAAVLGGEHPSLTIGNDVETATALEKMGAKHEACSTRDVIIDRERRIVTTPAYMLAQRISEAAVGIEALVREVLAMVEPGNR
jgi:enhancing lycopene biosynthesis protein 2